VGGITECAVIRGTCRKRRSSTLSSGYIRCTSDAVREPQRAFCTKRIDPLIRQLSPRTQLGHRDKKPADWATSPRPPDASTVAPNLHYATRAKGLLECSSTSRCTHICEIVDGRGTQHRTLCMPRPRCDRICCSNGNVMQLEYLPRNVVVVFSKARNKDCSIDCSLVRCSLAVLLCSYVWTG
jgi:hypothetical protein